MRRKNQHRVGHMRQQSPNRKAHHITAGRATIVKQITTFIIQKADMHMQTTSRAFGIGFGHKAGRHTVLARYIFGNIFEQHRIIGHFKQIILMRQRHFKLATSTFAGSCINSNILCRARRIKISQKGIVIIKFIDCQHRITHRFGTIHRR